MSAKCTQVIKAGSVVSTKKEGDVCTVVGGWFRTDTAAEK